MTSKYDRVRIIGPDHNNAFREYLTDRSCSEQGEMTCLQIGDGKRTITMEEIGNKLRGKITQNTQIEMLAHGMVVQNKHYIALKSGMVFDAFDLEETSNVLLLLDSCTPEPIQCYFESCYGGAIAPYGLKRKSIVVSYAESDTTALDVSRPITHSQHSRLKDFSPREKVLFSLRETYQTLTYYESLGVGGNFTFVYRPLHTDSADGNTVKNTILAAESRFIKDCETYGNKDWKDFEYATSAPTDREAHSYINGRLRVLSELSSKKEKDFLFDDIGIKKFIGVDATISGFLMYAAIKQNDPNKIEYLVNSGVNPNLPTTHLTPVVDAIICGSLQALKTLIHYGADVNQPYLGMTPITWAIEEKQWIALDMLYVSGANLTSINYLTQEHKGRWLKYSIDRDISDIIKFLIEDGFDINSPLPECHLNAIEYAVCTEKWSLTDLLQEHGGILNEEEMSCSCVAYPIDHHEVLVSAEHVMDF